MVIHRFGLLTESRVWAKEDRQTGMDHRTACQLLILHQIALERDQCATTGSAVRTGIREQRGWNFRRAGHRS